MAYTKLFRIGPIGVGFTFLVASCSAGGSKTNPFASGSPEGNTSATAAPTQPTLNLMGPTAGASGLNPGAGVNGAVGDGCNDFKVEFTPQTPTVMFVVDRSSSMFDSHYWEPLKAAVLNVVKALDRDVNFGFAAYTGVNGGTCPMLNVVDSFALGNAPVIQQAYDMASADPRIESGAGKTETPTMRAIEQMIPKLVAAPGPGSKYFVLVTDGEPDFCNDGQEPCAKDQSVAAVQTAYTQGITTFVLGLGSVDALADLANAGAGQPVKNPGQDLGYCGSNPLKGSYAPTGGNAKVFAPELNETALTDQLRAVVAGVKSCVFDLESRLELDPANAGLGKVVLNGTALPYQDPNGWQLKGTTQIELLGTACKSLQDPATSGILFDFPCKAVIIR
ncbi:MAG: vWA domain-containing protein [Polyangiaceae bacterium]|nr:vWA domain-containing protein [Polyangiaceae bacterium]